MQTYYLSRICTFDLVKVWIFPNSTVCTSLLEFDELLLFTMFCVFNRTRFHLVVPLTAEFQGLRFVFELFPT